jgi:hypothetical protein
MRRTVLLLALITASSTAALGQTNAKRAGFVSEVGSAATAPCRGADLSVRKVTSDQAMGGHVLIDYALKNNASAPCTLKGYPRFELLDKSGKVRPHGRATNSQKLPGDDAKQPPQLLTIEPGKEAGFRVYYNSGGAGYIGKPCPVVRKVRITLPGTTRRFVLREQITFCTTLQVSAVRSQLSQ